MANYVENIKAGSGETWPVRDVEAHAAIDTLEAAVDTAQVTAENAQTAAEAAKTAAESAQSAANAAQTAANAAQTKANAALPITGGQLTGYARAVSPSTGRNDGELYNIRVVNNAYNAVLGGYQYIDFQLKG